MKFKTYVRTVIGELNLRGVVHTFDKAGYWIVRGTDFSYTAPGDLGIWDYEYMRLYIEYKVYCYVRNIEPETIEGTYILV